MVKTILKIDGMMCGMCEAHVNDAIRKAMPEAKKITSSHTKGESSFLSETEPNMDGLKEAIEKTGYIVLSMHTEAYEKKKFFGWCL
ncbi:MAG: heavy-metal-associated domain-containing protein [Lachnospiraceae bacterium]|nr:heavy-metal-associated domain-containing protein [Lachnospiraceae bacterium]